MESPRSNLRSFLIASVLVNLILAPLVVALAVQDSNLRGDLSNFSKEINSLNQQLDVVQKQLSFYKSQAQFYSSKTKGEAAVGKASINLVAVTMAGGAYAGLVMRLSVELIPGDGRVLVDTQPRIGIDIQTSARTARQVAERFTGISLSGFDIILTVVASQSVKILDGPSAGAAIAVAIISALKDQQINPEVYMTGTISGDGSIGHVGGVLEKALAVARMGAQTFLVPPGESSVVKWIPEEREVFPGVKITTFKQVRVSVAEELQKSGYSMDVKEISSIADAYRLFTQ